jgi:hypothetical protein
MGFAIGSKSGQRSLVTTMNQKMKANKNNNLKETT